MTPLLWAKLALVGGLVALAGLQTMRLADEKAGHATTRENYAEHRLLAERAARTQTEQFTAQASAWRATQTENADAHRVYTDELLGLLAGARSSLERMRSKVNSLAAAAGKATRDPGAQPGSPTAGQAADLLAYMYKRIDEAADGVGAYADRAAGAGSLCERDYDALKSQPLPGSVGENLTKPAR